MGRRFLLDLIDELQFAIWLGLCRLPTQKNADWLRPEAEEGSASSGRLLRSRRCSAAQYLGGSRCLQEAGLLRALRDEIASIEELEHGGKE